MSAVVPGLERRGGLWLGSSGRTVERPEVRHAHRGGVEYVTVDLTPGEQTGYYEGFSNRTLWPLMHGLLVRAEVRRGDYAIYRAVARRLAQVALEHLQPDDLVWVHDYQPVCSARTAGPRRSLGGATRRWTRSAPAPVLSQM